MIKRIEPVKVKDLLLDNKNPRLPEGLIGKSQEEILKYLWDYDALIDIIDSYIQNGYFPTEPIITLPPNSEGKRVVIEGNRRLASLLILLESEIFKSSDIRYERPNDIADDILEQLEKIPAAEASSRDSITAYLGFRHVSGLRQWGAAEKARWIYEQIRKNKEYDKDSKEFYNLGRKIGSNAAGVKNSYAAYSLLLHCRENLDAPVEQIQYVLKERFTVWQRLIYNSIISESIGFSLSGAYSLAEVDNRINLVKEKEILDILSDISPDKDGKSIITDSRQVQSYAKVVSSKEAYKVLRGTKDFSLSVKISENANVIGAIESIITQIKVATTSLDDYDPEDGDYSYLEDATKNFKKASQKFIALSRSKINNEDDLG